MSHIPNEIRTFLEQDEKFREAVKGNSIARQVFEDEGFFLKQ